MEQHCPILGRTTRVEKIGRAPAPWQLLRCSETGFVFLKDPPNYEAVATEFDWHSTFVEEKQNRRRAEPVVARCSDWLKRCRVASMPGRNPMFEMACRLVDGKSRLAVLDVGTGRGYRVARFCEDFRDLGVAVRPAGIEISAELAKIAGDRLAEFGGEVIHSPAVTGMSRFNNEQFDLVIMSCYLEHEAQPLEVLRNVAPILKSGGAILVKVPNYNSWNRSLRGSRWCGYRYPDHVNYFTPETLQLLAETAGYQMLTQRWRDCLPTSDNMYAVLRRSA